MRSLISRMLRPLRAFARYEIAAPVNLVIILGTSAVFAAQKYLGRNAPGVDRLWFDLGYDRHLVLTGREPWRLITPNLIHTANWWQPGGTIAWIGTIGLLHLLSVVIALLAFGPLIERTFGHRKYFVLYAVTGTAAYALLLIRSPGPYLQGGATGAVYGVFAAFLIVWLLHRREPAYARLTRPAVTMFVILAAAQYGWNAGAPHLLHVGGFAAGIVLGLLLDPRTPQEPEVTEQPPVYQPISYPDLTT